MGGQIFQKIESRGDKKLLELTQFASPILPIYFNFARYWGLLWERKSFLAQSMNREV